MSLRSAGLLVLVLLAAGCSSYQREFRKAVAGMPRPANSVNGPWVGEWRSEMNGHHGPLWCVIEPRGVDRHAFRYRAGWGVLQFGDYLREVATSTDASGVMCFEDSMDLPGGAGVHHVSGRVTSTGFEARYRSEAGDRGTMRLSRPE